MLTSIVRGPAISCYYPRLTHPVSNMQALVCQGLARPLLAAGRPHPALRLPEGEGTPAWPNPARSASPGCLLLLLECLSRCRASLDGPACRVEPPPTGRSGGQRAAAWTPAQPCHGGR